MWPNPVNYVTYKICFFSLCVVSFAAMLLLNYARRLFLQNDIRTFKVIAIRFYGLIPTLVEVTV